LAPLLADADAVISALGVSIGPRTILDPPPLYTEGTLRIVRAMQATGRLRLGVISAAFAAPAPRMPLWFRTTAALALHRLFQQMADMERVLQATDTLQWTAFRPGWLLDLPHSGDATVQANVLPRGMIRTRRADLAAFMVETIGTDRWVRATPVIARKEARRYEAPPALLRELI
jgi:hypothetical protein